MKKHFSVIVVLLFFICPMEIYSQNDSTNIPFLDSIIEEIEDYNFLEPLDEVYPYLEFPMSNFENLTQSFEHTFTIQENDTVFGNIIVKKGDLIINGILLGDALVMKGDVYVNEDGKVSGDITTFKGKVYSDGIVSGIIEERNSKKSKFEKVKSENKNPKFYTPRNWFPEHYFGNTFILRFNRVENFEIGFARSKKFNPLNIRPITSHWMFTYSTGLHKWEGEFGLSRNIEMPNSIFQFSGEIHSLVDSDDNWIVNDKDNSTMAAFSKDDYLDYFHRSGASVGVQFHHFKNSYRFFAGATYLKDKYTSLRKNTNWSLFGKNEYRENPAVDEGEIPSLIYSAGYSTTSNTNFNSTGWNIYATHEIGGFPDKKNYSFNKTIVDVRRYQLLTEFESIRFRVRFGELNGDQIEQRKLFLGGYNTLPSFSYKEFSGNRMILLNSEYHIKGNLIGIVLPWIDNVNLILLANAGEIKNYSKTELNVTKKFFKSLTLKNIKSDAGIGLGWGENDGRLSCLWNLDKKELGRISFQLSYPF